MRTKIATILTLALLTVASFSYAQTTLENETFKCSLTTRATGAHIKYSGSHYGFSLQITGKNVRQQNLDGAAENQEFVTVDNTVFQTSLVPLQLPLPDDYKLSALTIDQQKAILGGYVDYELDYFDKELHAKPNDVKKEWVVINSRAFMIWYFNFKVENPDGKMAKVFSGQVYLSGICFNQVLDINSPIGTKNGFSPAIEKLKAAAATLVTYNHP